MYQEVLVKKMVDYKLKPAQLRKKCDPEIFKFKSTATVKPLDEIAGQDRAVKAIEFGFGIKSEGFNIYVAGAHGTGKMATVLNYAKKKAKSEMPPDDWCYVYNFVDPDQPIAISLEHGGGRKFAAEMEELVEACRREIPKAFEGADYDQKRNEVVGHFQAQQANLIAGMRKQGEESGFGLELSTSGMVTVPIVDSRPMTPEEYEQLSDAEKRRIQKRSEELKLKLNEAITELKKIEKEIRERMRELNEKIANFTVGHLFAELKKIYNDNEEIIEFLEDVQNDMIDNLEIFRPSPRMPVMLPGLEEYREESHFYQYQVNVIVDNSELEGAPVVVEHNPTYYNLFGQSEYRAQFGSMVTDFGMVKAGAIHRAQGGYLILRAIDVLMNPWSWDGIKRMIKDGEVRIENIGEQYRFFPVSTLKPEPFPIRLKLILVGSPMVYRLLYHYDEDFHKLFKVKADFDLEMGRSKTNEFLYAAYISTKCKADGLCHFNPKAVSAVVEYGSVLSGDQTKLSARLDAIGDLVSEASFYASLHKRRIVSAADVEEALSSRRGRSSLIDDKIKEMILNGTLMIDLKAPKVGQVNGLSVYDMGDYSFGKPTKITAETFIGRAGIINIERETKMSGRIHAKGVLILSGYLAGTFAQKRPLAMTASICFEQSYEEVEGDSASTAELLAVLSSLAQVPLRQDIAITGSVNQKGEIQPIGGVNEKIAGFYDICKLQKGGLTGKQGVIIPAQNVRNLMLDNEIVEAVAKGRFHIHQVKKVEDAIAIMTSMEPGKRLKNGTFSKGSFFDAVDLRLKEMSEKTIAMNREKEGNSGQDE